jgi:hypothetical protein
MPSRLTALAIAPLIALALTAAAPFAGAADAPPRFGGEWKLNEKKSEDFREKMQAMRGPGGEGGGGGGMHGGFGGGGGGGWGGHGGGGGGYGGGGGGWGGRHGGGGQGSRGAGPNAEGGGPPDSTRQAEMRWLMEPPAMLLIEQTDSTVVLSDKGTTIQTLAFNAAAGAAPSAASGPLYDAKWKGSHLEATRSGARGRKVSETFELGGDGKVLTIVTKVEAGQDRPTVEFKRVYDKYEGVN